MNAGGIIDVYYQRKMSEPGYSAQNYASDLATKVEEIGDTLKEIFERSAAENIPTFMVADRVAEERFNKTDLIRQPIKSDAPAATQFYSKSV